MCDELFKEGEIIFVDSMRERCISRDEGWACRSKYRYLSDVISAFVAGSLLDIAQITLIQVCLSKESDQTLFFTNICV